MRWSSSTADGGRSWIPYSAICRSLRAFVYDVGGRIVLVHPVTQIVWKMFSWVTSGFVMPGVQMGSGRAPRAWQGPTAEVSGMLAWVGATGPVVLEHPASS